MSLSYLDAVQQGFPTVMVICTGSPMIYNDLQWTGGDALPSQDDLDAWIAEQVANTLSKYQFRQLFTLNEKVAIDNAQANPNIPANYKEILLSVMKDLELSDVVHLDNPQVSQGLGLLVQLGLLTSARVTQILAKTPAPSA